MAKMVTLLRETVVVEAAIMGAAQSLDQELRVLIILLREITPPVTAMVAVGDIPAKMAIVEEEMDLPASLLSATL